jgi:hypothetical protein
LLAVPGRYRADHEFHLQLGIQWIGSIRARILYGPLTPIQDACSYPTGVELASPSAAPRVNALSQNRPNPFNPETDIPYSLASPRRVTIKIFNVSGRCIRTAVARLETAGQHVARRNGKTDQGVKAASGVYFYRVTYPDGSSSAKKLTILE